jgi:hypothetical protein
MSDSPRIGDYILRFDDAEAGGDQEVLAERFIEGRADRDIRIEKYKLGEFYDSRFRIPDYQREYEWGEDEWDNLWEELNRLITADPTSTSWIMNDVFFGSMFFSERDAAKVIETDEEGVVLDIIDGQQRITTLSIVFKILADELRSDLAECDPSFIGRHSHHVGDANRLVYNTSDPESKVSLILDNKDDQFYRRMMNGSQERLDYILDCNVVNNNMIYGAIKIEEYLDLMRIDKMDYLKALFDDDRFGEAGSNRPNLNSSRASIIDNVDDPESLSKRQERELLKNKVEFDKVSERLAKGYDYFYSKITDVLEDYSTPEKRYRASANVKDYILNDYHVGYFRVKDDRPQLLMRIFEVLNDRGVDLKKTDLIRTRLVTRLREEGVDDELYDEYIRKWRKVINTFGKEHDVIIEFLTTYFVVFDTADEYTQVTSRGQVSDHLLEAFTLRDDGSEKRKLRSHLTTVDDATELVDSIRKYASYYHDIQNPAETGIQIESADENIVSRCNRILLRLARSSSDIWEPIVLAYYYDIDNGEMGTAEDLLDLLQTVESIVIRYYVSGDVNKKDRIYANAIRTYHATGDPDEILERMVETVQTDDTIIGQDLIDSICTTEWDSNRAKQVFRMIDSSHLEEQKDGVVTQRLNRDNSIVHLEHIFPSSPLLSGDETYDWIRTYFQLDGPGSEDPNYFDLDTDEYDLLQEGLGTFGDLLEDLIEDESDQDLEDVAEQFSTSLGNQLLLWCETNMQISNKKYSKKLPAYGTTTNFDQLLSNQFLRTAHMSSEEYKNVELRYVLQQVHVELTNSGKEYNEINSDIIDKYESQLFSANDQLRTEFNELLNQASTREELMDAIQTRIESDDLVEASEIIDKQWTLESTTRNLVAILTQLTEVLSFDAVDILGDEFNDVNLEYRAQREMNRKRGVVGFNYAE